MKPLLPLALFLALAHLASAQPAAPSSAPATDPTVLLVGPSSQTAAVGSTAIFSVSLLSENPGRSYQWLFNSKPLTDGPNVSGAKTSKLTVKNIQMANDGAYTVAITSPAAPVDSMPSFFGTTSPPAYLGVMAQPPATPTGIPATVFDVTKYHAVGDATTDNTAAIQAALNAARDAGGGIVRIPAGIFLCGPITLYSKINFQIADGATLRLLPKSSFGARGAGSAMISATNPTDLIISGHGTIDGQGADWWAAFRANAGTARPYLIRLSGDSRVLVEDVSLLNSPMFHLAFSGNGSNLTAVGLTATAPSNSPNTDAIDPSGHDIFITHCNLSIGDDNIAIKGSGTHCANITVANCIFGTGHGLSIGGQTNAGVENMIAYNCTFNGTTSGIRLKADPTQGGLTQNISYSNMTMTNVQYPIVLYSYYVKVGNPGVASGSNYITPARAAQDNASIMADGGYVDFFVTKAIGTIRNRQANAYSLWRNISFSNITSTGGKGYNVIWGLPDHLVENVTFNNCHFSGDYGFEIYDATNIQFTGNSSITATKSKPLIVGFPDGDTNEANVTNSLVLTTQPASQSVKPGAPAEFSVTAAASPAPTYQWLKNGTPIPNATSAKLKIPAAVAHDAATYTVTVTNAIGSATSSPATLTLTK